MGIEIVGALVIVLALVVLAARLMVPGHGRRRRTAADPQISPEDRRLLPFLSMTSGQWLSLTNSQRADLREQAYRGKP